MEPDNPQTQTIELIYPDGIRPYQTRVLTSDAFDTVVISAPQLGKTTIAQFWLFGKAAAHGPDIRPHWWTAPTYYQARHGYMGIVEIARNAGLLRDYTTTPPLRLRLKTGGVIQALSWDRPEGMYGPSVLTLVADEFGRLTSPAYSAMSSRRAETIAQGFGHALWIGNVGEIGSAAEDLWNQAESGQAGFRSFRWTWRDRALAHPCPCELDPDIRTAYEHGVGCARGVYCQFIAREASRMSAPQFRQLYGAEWADWNDLPVFEFDRQVHVADAPIRIQKDLPLDLACDFNVDPMVWVIGQHHKTEAWAIDEIVIQGNATTQEASNELIRRYPFHELTVDVYGDRSGNARDTKSKTTDYGVIRKVLGAFFREVRMRVPKANPSITASVNAFNAKLAPMIGAPTYRISPTCKVGAVDLARTSWKPGTRDIDKSKKSQTHWSDAERYRIARLFPIVERPDVQIETAGEDTMLQEDPIVGTDF
jgi:hypothetical protein